VREDAAGNTFARWAGKNESLAPVGTGSHIDAIPNAGRYDGTWEFWAVWKQFVPLCKPGSAHAVRSRLLIFTSEEPTRFGIGCLGSRLLAGVLDASCDERLKDHDSKSLGEIRAAAGYIGPLSAVRLPSGYYSAFIELHIEQGPLLEQRQVPVAS